MSVVSAPCRSAGELANMLPLAFARLPGGSLSRKEERVESVVRAVWDRIQKPVPLSECGIPDEQGYYPCIVDRLSPERVTIISCLSGDGTHHSYLVDETIEPSGGSAKEGRPCIDVDYDLAEKTASLFIKYILSPHADGIIDKGVVEEWAREALLQKTLHSRLSGVVPIERLLKDGLKDGRVYTITPWYNLGDFIAVLELKDQHLPIKKKLLQKNVCRQLLQILAKWEEANWVHRDMKADNILARQTAEGDIEIVLCDVAYAKDCALSEQRLTLQGTAMWTAPEYADLIEWKQEILQWEAAHPQQLCPERADFRQALRQRTQPALDVWGAGMFCAYLLGYRDLFEEISDSSSNRRMGWFQGEGWDQDKRMHPFQDDLGDEVFKWVKGLLHPRPECRTGAKWALEQFNKLDEEKKIDAALSKLFPDPVLVRIAE